MAFRKDKTTAAQTSANAAGTVVAALVQAGLINDVEAASEQVGEIFDVLFARLGPIVEADNLVFAEAEASEPRSGGSSRSAKTGGGRRGSKPTLEGAMTLVMNSGAFEGKTLGDILEIDADTADADYDYGDGERNGRDYISWLATDKNKNTFVRERARLIAEAEGLL